MSLKVSEVAKVTSGGTPSRQKPNYWNGGIPWVTTPLIAFNRITESLEFISEEDLVNSAAKLFPKGTLIMALYGQGVARGKVAILDFEAATNQACAALLIQQDGVETDFLFYELQRRYDELRNLSNDGGQKNLSGDLVKNLRITLPSLPEQRKIADFLAAVDKRIGQLAQKKALLEDYKKGAMQQLFSQAIRFKDDEGKDFPDWEEKKLGEVLTIGSGKDYKHLGKGDIPVYGSGGLMTYVNSSLYDGESVGIGRKGTIDKPRFLEGPFWTVDTLFYTHSFESVLPRFIYALFQRINWRAYNEAGGVPSLSKSTIEKIPISIPSLPEQTKIANFLAALDRKIESVATQIRETQTFKRGLLQQMFV